MVKILLLLFLSQPIEHTLKTGFSSCTQEVLKVEKKAIQSFNLKIEIGMELEKFVRIQFTAMRLYPFFCTKHFPHQGGKRKQ
jgi:hypothetical protein